VLAQAERQAEVDCIDKLGPFQNKITAPGNRPDVLLNDLGQHAWVDDRAPIWIAVERSSPWGTSQKNSLRSSRDGGSTTSLYGLAEISSTRTQMMWLMT